MKVNGEKIARKGQQCVTCGRRIEPGHRYMSYTAFPNDDCIGGQVPYRFGECLDCVLDRAARRAG